MGCNVDAAVFCVDEKTAIQALDRLDPVLPLSPGRLERHGFEYYRHGTLSLYAAFNTRSGEVLGKTVARHTSQEFVAFLSEVVANQPLGKQIHIIADKPLGPQNRAGPGIRAHSSRSPPALHADLFLVAQPARNCGLPKIERDVIARGVFTSVKDLARKLMLYIRHYNRNPKPIKWMYRNSKHRIMPDTILSVTGN